LDEFEAPVKKLDEFQYFSQAMKFVYNSSQETYENLIHALTKKQEKQYKILLQSKKVEINEKEKVTRKIIKPKYVVKP